MQHGTLSVSCTHGYWWMVGECTPALSSNWQHSQAACRLGLPTPLRWSVLHFPRKIGLGSLDMAICGTHGSHFYSKLDVRVPHCDLGNSFSVSDRDHGEPLGDAQSAAITKDAVTNKLNSSIGRQVVRDVPMTSFK